jgi:hypothetical protein
LSGYISENNDGFHSYSSDDEDHRQTEDIFCQKLIKWSQTFQHLDECETASHSFKSAAQTFRDNLNADCVIMVKAITLFPFYKLEMTLGWTYGMPCSIDPFWAFWNDRKGKGGNNAKRRFAIFANVTSDSKFIGDWRRNIQLLVNHPRRRWPACLARTSISGRRR